MSQTPEHHAGDRPAASETPDWAAFLLCGGLGTRLGPVTNRPKAVLEVAGWPFLRFHLELLEPAAPRRTVLLTGHGGDEVERAFGPATDRRLFLREEEPLGTGGALARGKALAADQNWIANGDSFAEVDPGRVLALADAERGIVVAVRTADRSDYGGLRIGGDGTILEFEEKGRTGEGWINAGIYLLPRRMLADLPEGRSSLEREHLPRWAREGRLRAHPVEAFFLDIGTPERLRRADHDFVPIRRRLEAASRLRRAGGSGGSAAR
ncbi:MAG: nucleotidyl transferase [Candidatus Eisenbacteria bacterium]|nr:nucleotidyl transferase [Candidatus Eisenbacteria bacterium]